MVLRENEIKRVNERSSDGVTEQFTYFAHAHSILANTKRESCATEYTVAMQWRELIVAV